MGTAVTQEQVNALLTRIQQLEDQVNNLPPVPPAAPPAAPQVVVQPPTAVQETFVTNPYQGNINPTTSNGLKMYQSATTARETLLNPKIKTKKEFLDAMVSDFCKIWLG